MEIKEVNNSKGIEWVKKVTEAKKTAVDWKRKFTSRKFWAAVIGFVTALLVAFNVDKLTIEQVVAIISALGTLVAYIIGEGMTDVAGIKEKISEKE